MEATRKKRPGRPSRKETQFDRAVDDLLSKKYGRGYIYYGERARLQTDDEEEEQPPEIDEYLKDDAVLVVGGTGRTGQWITLGLLNQNFNVRVLTRDYDRAEKLFGPSGSNVDVFEGDLRNPETLSDAVDGAIAVVIAAAPEWWQVGGGAAVEGKGGAAVVKAAAATDSVKRIILLSTLDSDTARSKHKRVAEDAVRSCGIPYVIVRSARLSNEQGGMSEIEMKQSDRDDSEEQKSRTVGRLARVDAAQVICQALAYERSVNSLASLDPESELRFGSCTVEVSNTDQPGIVDASYWKRAYSKLVTE